MNCTHSIGVIGAGMWGKKTINALREDPRAQVTWVCDASSESAQSAAAEFGIRNRTLDYREMLADPALQAVVIATPPYLHCQQFLDALAAGKHVLIEKPLTVSRESMARMTAAAAATDRVTLEGSCRHARLQPKFGFLREFVRSGRLGRIYHIHHQALVRTTFIEYNPKGAWAMNKSLAGGGPLVNWGVYDLSFHLGLLDDVPVLRSVRSFHINGLRDLSKRVAFTDVEQHGAAWLEFDGGLTYYYERSAGAHGEAPNETRVHGTKGSLQFQFTSWDSKKVEFFHGDDPPLHETLEVDMNGAIPDEVALTRHFLDCIDGKAVPAMPVERAAKHLEILFKILEKG